MFGLIFCFGWMGWLCGAEVGELSIRDLVPLNALQRASLQALVRDDAEAKALFDKRQAGVSEIMARKPQPLEVIHYEGLVNTDPRRIETVKHLQDMDDLAALYEVWQVTGEPALAQTCRRRILAWARRYIPTGNDVNENKLTPIFVAWPDLREGASERERKQVEQWLTALGDLQAMEVREAKGQLTNRYTKSLRLLYLLGVAVDRKEWRELALEGYRRFVEDSLRPDGGSADLERRDTLTYHCSSLRPLLELAVLSPEGGEWYRWESSKGSSVQKSVNYVVPYADGSKTRKEWVNTTVELDRKRAAAGLEEYLPGRLFEPKRALPLLEQASAFDPALAGLVLRLEGNGAKRFPTWRMVLNAAISKG